MNVKDKFSYIYITAKIHKTPWKTCPIVSAAGSILHGLGRWVDSQLQAICQKLPTYLRSSFDLKQDLECLVENEQLDFSRVRMFTAGAASMYTNMDTYHAMQTISVYLRQNRFVLPQGTLVEALISNGLNIVMRNNYFRFGDTYWKQLTGTAMGTPSAPMYATLYYNMLSTR